MNKEVTPCKGRSRNTSSYFCPYRASLFLSLITQGVALGYGIHWAFSPFKFNPRLELLTRQPVNLLTRLLNILRTAQHAFYYTAHGINAYTGQYDGGAARHIGIIRQQQSAHAACIGKNGRQPHHALIG